MPDPTSPRNPPRLPGFALPSRGPFRVQAVVAGTASVADRVVGNIGAQIPQVGVGLPPREAALVQQAIEILRRHLSQPPGGTPRCEDYEDYLHLHIAAQRRERFIVLFLGPGNELIGEDAMFSGDAVHVQVCVSEILREAYLRGASGVIVAHNHPSGPALPSEADMDCLATIRGALAQAGIRYVDDIIVSRTDTFSHRRTGDL